MKSDELLQELTPTTARLGTKTLPTLDIAYPSRRALLSAAASEGSRLTLFVLTHTAVPLGSGVKLRITIAGTSQAFELMGTVLDHAWTGPGSRPSGLTVCFQGEDKRYAAKIIAFCANRPTDMGTASSQRQEIELRCRVSAGRGSWDAVVFDLSRTGAFIVTDMLRGIRPGSPLRVQLEPSVLGLGGTWLDAKVIWLGDKCAHAGFGIQFLGVNGKQTKILNKYLGAAHH